MSGTQERELPKDADQGHSAFWQADASWKCSGSATGFPDVMRQHNVSWFKQSSRLCARAFSRPRLAHSSSTRVRQPSRRQKHRAGRGRSSSYPRSTRSCWREEDGVSNDERGSLLETPQSPVTVSREGSCQFSRISQFCDTPFPLRCIGFPVSAREASHVYKMGVGLRPKRTRGHDTSHEKLAAKEKDQGSTLRAPHLRSHSMGDQICPLPESLIVTQLC
jgi:hypothetical protein